MYSLLSLMESLGAFQLGSGDDKILWTLDNKKSFSTKSLFHKLTECPPKLKVHLIKQIWKFNYPKKVKVFLWSLAQRSINTHEIVQKTSQVGAFLLRCAVFVTRILKTWTISSHTARLPQICCPFCSKSSVLLDVCQRR